MICQRIRILPHEYIPVRYHYRELWVRAEPPQLIWAHYMGQLDYRLCYIFPYRDTQTGKLWIIPKEDGELLNSFAEITEKNVADFDECLLPP